MTISDKATRFGNKAIVDWEPGVPIDDPVHEAYRIQVEYDDDQSWVARLAQFVEDPRAGEVTALVAGPWDPEMGAGGPETLVSLVSALVAARDKLKKLTALFIGDITFEECEISWINQGNVAPLCLAYPKLHHLRLRGGNSLELGKVSMVRLQSLIIEAGGLPGQVVRDVLRCDLPALEHLELWLGTENYGATTAIGDLAPLFEGAVFPKLKYLGLRDSDIADDIAEAIVTAPVLERITTLDLSLGILSDRGAAALAGSKRVRQLKKLDIHHHYCTSDMVAQLKALGIRVNADEPQLKDGEDEDYRYVAVGE